MPAKQTLGRAAAANTATKWLWDARRSIGVWTVAISAVGGLYAALWPTIDDPGFQLALESYPEGLIDALNYDDIATPAGYLSSSVYGLIVALLLLIYATAAGARSIAGDEQDGLLDLVAGHPISRTRLALERFGALTISIGLMSAFFLVVMLALRGPADLVEISIGGFVAMHTHLALFAVLFGSVAYAVGAATGRRGLALGAGAALGLLAYLANGILPTINGLESVDQLSPFNWLVGGDPLRNGLQPVDVLLMVALASVLVGAGTWAFNRRDLAS